MENYNHGEKISPTYFFVASSLVALTVGTIVDKSEHITKQEQINYSNNYEQINENYKNRLVLPLPSPLEICIECHKK